MPSVLDKTIACLAEVFRNQGLEPPELSGGTTFDPALGLDSLDYAELAVRLEHAFGFDPFAGGETPEIRTVSDLAQLYEQPAAS